MATKHTIHLTFSKIFAFLVLVAGTFVSIKLHSENIFITTIVASSSLIANKQYQDRIKTTKGIISDATQQPQ